MQPIVRHTPLGALWRTLEQSGWVEGLDPAERRELRERLAAALAVDRAAVLPALATTSVELECIEGSGPEDPCSYHSVLRQLADASRGRFRPEDILDELDRDLHVARVSFCLGEQSFHCEVPFLDERLQPGVIELVNRALEATGVAERFQLLPTGGEPGVLHLAFVSEAALARAREAGLVPRSHP